MRRSIKLARLVVVLSMVVVAAWPVPAHAAPSSALCVVQFKGPVTPAQSLTTPHTSTLYSGGLTGTAQCIGTVNGQEVTGQGSAGSLGAVYGTCLGGGIAGLLVMQVPTKGGTQTVSFPYNAQHAGGIGQLQGGAFPSTFLLGPTKGDCTTTLATEMSLTFVGTLSS